MNHRYPAIRQENPADCGAACLEAVARFHGRRVYYSGIASAPPASRRAVNAAGLHEAAVRLGFTARLGSTDWAGLAALAFPAIADCSRPDEPAHFVVVFACTTDTVTVMDPARGDVREVSRAAFEAEWTGVVLGLSPTDQIHPMGPRAPAALRFLRLVTPHHAVLAQALLGGLVYSGLALLTAVYVQKLVDYVIVDGNRNLLNLMSVAMLAILVLQLGINAARKVFVLRVGQRIDGWLVLAYYRHLLRMPQSFFDGTRVGDVVSRMTDAIKIRRFLNSVALDLVVNLLIVALSFLLILLYSWELGVVVVALLALYAGIYYVTNRVNRSRQRVLAEKAAEFEAQLVESLNAVTTIKRLNLERHAAVQTEVRFTRMLRHLYRSACTAIAADSASDFTARVFTVILLWAGAVYVLNGNLTPGQLLSSYALVMMLTTPLASLVSGNQTVQDALIAADRLFEVMDREVEADPPHAVELPPDFADDIRFEHVTFGYRPDARVFNDLSLTVPRGQIVAIVGESGAGKSTLVALLQKIYHPQEGRIVFGEHDLRYVANTSLRRAIGVVPQKTELFTGSIVENIAVGDYEPDMDRILEVCDTLGLTPIIERMPHGFETLLSQDGSNLSGGQRQRLAIARALYREPTVLLLDEATSSLDTASEQHVQRAIQALRERGRTVVIIAHRLNTVAIADKIVVLDSGRIVEEGSHEQLVRREGRYHELLRYQIPAPRLAIARE